MTGTFVWIGLQFGERAFRCLDERKALVLGDGYTGVYDGIYLGVSEPVVSGMWVSFRKSAFAN